MIKSKSTIVIIIGMLLISINSIAQKKEICGEVYYTNTTNLSSIYSENYLMKFTNKQSYCEEIGVESSKDSKEKVNSDEGLTHNVIIGRKNVTPKFFYNSKSSFYFRDNFFDKVLLVKEEPYHWKWDLYQEKKRIGGFLCQKAMTKFRGRTYVAWFTNEIPVPFGPWKFQGLSGLILEVYDVDRVFHIAANKIKIGEKQDCAINVEDSQLLNALTITSYLEEKEQLIDAEFMKLSSRMPKGFKVPKRDKNCDDCSEEIEKF